ncbi:hypothetical protein CEW89_06060 [Celeribacter ethanolicus]|uniref:Alpha/beta hydrolase n=1 Tax=Celeribacter ethanolicus TaxID=1758178 RepID=A0A291GAV1_9RHOB|nr:hypothetical protein [Celeribacter ethanolicus]ATG47170.1 hypothetical protein CEW89_06060 [Celeribacter ethanolicus]
MSEQGKEVTRRRVFYIPGYDPIPPRRYRELYRKEGAAQAEMSGYTLGLAPKKGRNFGWSVAGEIEGAQTRSDIDVLVWSDIVQQSMAAGIFRTYLILARTAWTYVSTGALFRLMKLRRGPMIAALYPIGVLLAQLLIAVLLLALITWSGRLLGAAWIGLVPGLLAAFLLLRWFKAKDDRIFAYYLMHDYGFSARWRGADPPALRARMDEFRAEIAEALREDWDEVLVVGHSSGAHLGIQILADLIRAGEVPERGPVLSFLSLGHVVPMVSFLPEAKVLRRDLAYLSTRDELFWLDVTAPGDPCSFALCDPIKVSGVAPADQKWPLVISAAFTQTLSPEKQARLKRRFFRLHFQYLCAFDRPGEYDYFKITAGGETLAARFAGAVPSPSRIDTPANRFTEMAEEGKL